MSRPPLTHILEAALLAAGEPLPLDRLQDLFPDSERPQRAALRQALDDLAEELNGRGIELQEVASGYRLQVRKEFAPWISRLWEERPTRYSRALLETLAVIAYRQPVTRAEIEEIRGVSLGTPLIRTLQEREWIRIVGHRDVPGRPAMFGTTRNFLDYFNLKNLSELPTLLELRGLDEIHPELDLRLPADHSGTSVIETSKHE